MIKSLFVTKLNCIHPRDILTRPGHDGRLLSISPLSSPWDQTHAGSDVINCEIVKESELEGIWKVLSSVGIARKIGFVSLCMATH